MAAGRPVAAPCDADPASGHYENRVREKSAPEKVFEYFASVQKDGEVYMTAEDFLRAITPFVGRAKDATGTHNFKYSWQASNEGPSEEAVAEYADLLQRVARDGEVDPEEVRDLERAAERLHVTKDAHFRALELAGMTQGQLDEAVERAGLRRRSSFADLVDLNGDGLISFTEFMFFIVLLSVPQRQVHLVLALMDVNGDGSVSQAEFDRVYLALAAATPAGRQSRDPSARYAPHGSRHFSKPASEGGGVDTARFASYVAALRAALAEYEFAHFSGGSAEMDAGEFAVAVVAHVPQTRLKQLLPRVARAANLEGSVTLSEFMAYRELAEALEPMAAAMRLLDVRTPVRGLSRQEFKCAAVAAVGSRASLTDMQVDVVFEVFDADESATLDVDEFVNALKETSAHGVTRRRDAGVGDWLVALWGCRHYLF